MIVSASRRTDLPAFYADWLLARFEQGWALVPHPWNARRLYRVRLDPDAVDAVVFWSKNPVPLADKLDRLEQLGFRRYYFTFTVTAYGPELEKGLPPKNEVVDTFRRLAGRLGPERVDWRFDPVLPAAGDEAARLFDRFDELCHALADSTGRCILNFVKTYAHSPGGLREAGADEVRFLAAGLARVAAAHGLPLRHCAGELDLNEFGIAHAACVDAEKIAAIAGYPLRAKKDPGQPATCRCAESVDLGMYNCCPHACVYCYANRGLGSMRRRAALHEPDSPMLIGRPRGDEEVFERAVRSLRAPGGPGLFGP